MDIVNMHCEHLVLPACLLQHTPVYENIALVASCIISCQQHNQEHNVSRGIISKVQVKL